MQTEPISKITNEKKDKALVFDFLQYINPWCHINSWSSCVTKANTKSGKWFSRGTEYVGFVVSLYFVTISKQWCFKFLVQWNLDLKKPDLRKNLDLRKIVGTTDFLVHKLFDLRKIF